MSSPRITAAPAALLASAAIGALALSIVGDARPSQAQLQLGPPVQNQPQQQRPAQQPPRPQQQPTRPARPATPNETPGPVGQEPPRERRQALPGDTVAPAPDETVIAPPRQRIGNQTAVFSGLDKITGRIIAFDVAINETVQFGALQVTPRVCYTRPPTETPQTTTFVEVEELTLSGDLRRLFAGWMFAASPGLSGVEHGVYDVWLTDCKQTPPTIQGAAQPPR